MLDEVKDGAIAGEILPGIDIVKHDARSEFCFNYSERLAGHHDSLVCKLIWYITALAIAWMRQYTTGLV